MKELQYEAKPSRPDPLMAKQLQELLGGQYGEITVAIQYLFQGWNSRATDKYRDLLMDVGTEEMAHIEMLSTMIARLLENAPSGDLEAAAKDPVTAAIIGGMNPQHAIVSGFGALPADSVGNRWTAAYVGASGNLLADFRANLTAESHGRLQAVRVYEASTDPGVKDMLSFLIARDTMHQNLWKAAIAEIEAQENIVVPATFPRELEKQQVAYDFYNLSAGEESKQGRWAHGPSMDSIGQFRYVSPAPAYGSAPKLKPTPPYAHNTPPTTRESSENDS